MTSIPTKKIIGWQFGILSSSEKKKLSYLKIDETATHEHNIDKKGTLYDSRMGTTGGGLCTTCLLSSNEDPGHFGLIKLPIPMFNPVYIDHIKKILICICFKCGRNRVNPHYYNYILSHPRKDRLKLAVNALTSNLECSVCGYINNIKYDIKQSYSIYYKIVSKKNKSRARKTPSNMDSNMDGKLYPAIVKKMFKNLRNIDIELFGFDVVHSHPMNMILTNIIVPPPTVRPVIFGTDMTHNRTEDNLYSLYSGIKKAISKLNKEISRSRPDQHDDSSGESRGYKEQWEDVLAIHISNLLTNRPSSRNEHSLKVIGGKKKVNSIKDMLKGKTGLIRGNIMGKRVNWSGRSVISGDSELDIDEIGVPVLMCMELCEKVHLNKYNYDDVVKWIRNGSKKWPGANKIVKRDSGMEISLLYGRKINIDMIIEKLNHGDIIYRHLIDGDYLLFNRQPTLHKTSIMGHRVKVLVGSDSTIATNTLRLNVCVTPPYNADFDGDEMNVFRVTEPASVCEIINIMAVPHHFIDPISSNVVVAPIQDNILGAYIMSKYSDHELSREEYFDIIGRAKYIDLTRVRTATDIYRAIECLEIILPPTFTMDSGGVIFRNSKYIEGIITKTTCKKMNKLIWHNYGPSASSRFLSSFQRITDRFMTLWGATISINDCYVDAKIKNKLKANLELARKENIKLLSDFNEGKITIPITQTPEQAFEYMVNNNIIHKYSKINSEILINHLESDTQNNFINMYKSGAKGETKNVSQILDSLGQQVIEGNRVEMSYGSRTLPFYTKYENSLESRGYVFQSFADGLDQDGYFFQAKSARMGIIDTAHKTAKTGRMGRELVKTHESVIASYDNMVRINNKMIVSFAYGGDHYDPLRLCTNQLLLKKMNIEEFIKYFV